MLDDFLVRAFLAGVGFATLAGPIGTFVVWRRMAYFGETLAHAALLGVALAFIFDTSVFLGVFALSAIAVLVLAALQRRAIYLARDTLLGVLATGTLALGVILASFVPAVRLDLVEYLFGDILAVSRGDLLWIYGGGVVAAAALVSIWRPLVAATVHDDLARVEGVATERVDLVFLLLLAVVVAAAIKIVGLLLIVALLIVPAAAARPWAGTPEAMALFAALAGVAAVASGIGASAAWDLPAGPAIVVAALLVFGLSLVFGKWGRRRGTTLT